MKMNDIRAEFGIEFIERFTNEFLAGVGAKFFPEEEIREEIRKVREHNYEPLFMEMMLAVFKLFEAKYREGLLKYKEAMDITVAELNVYDTHTLVQDKMIDYLQRQPTEKAKKAKAAQDAKWETVRQYALALAQKGSYPSRSQAVLAIKKEVLKRATEEGLSMSAQRANKTIDEWLAARGYNPYASKRGTSSS